ncbi:hypothetical protein [Caballeronia sordidicola]|uniref:hypothetical protein n=1 Tax=Caballeronia sordidicola TaxID=196367 RepID=UPI001363A901|nr:hypothetical protein [Caballeronia sordidicola]
MKVIVGAGGESVKGFIVLGACEKRVIVAVKNNYEKRVSLYRWLLTHTNSI